MHLKYRVGSVIQYETFTGEVRVVTVREVEQNIKNGMPGFSAVEPFWGYDHQITKVIKY